MTHPADDSLDPLLYGGEHVVTSNGKGVGRILIAPDKLLSQEFEMDVAAPYELADNQDTAAAIITFKGVDVDTSTVRAFTVIMSADALRSLARFARVKYADIPIEYR